jgi:hypothetical protein
MIMSETFDKGNKNKSYENNYFEEHFFILNIIFIYFITYFFSSAYSHHLKINNFLFPLD